MTRPTPHKYLLPIGLIIMGGLLAGAAGVRAMSAETETHGKLPVKLSEQFTLRFPTGTTGVAWSPDSSTLAVSSNYGGKLNTYDRSGHPLHGFEAKGNIGAYINNFALLNGASQVLFPIESIRNRDAALDIRDVATGRILQTLTRASARVRAHYFAVSPDQKRFAVANPLGNEVVTYSSDDGTHWHELSAAKEHITYADHNKQFWHGEFSICFFPDSKLLAVGKTEGYFAVVDSMTGETLKEFHPYEVAGNRYTPNIYSIAVSPHGDMLLTGVGGGGITDKSGAVTHFEGASIWRVSDGTQVASFPDPNKMIDQVAWDPKARFVAFTDNKSLFIWRPDQSNLDFMKIQYSGLTTSLALSRDGRSLAVAAGNKVIIYNVEDN